MIDRSRRAFLGALGATMGGTVLAKEGFKKADAIGRRYTNARNQIDPDDLKPEALRVNTPSRELTAKSVSLHPGLNEIDKWAVQSGTLSIESELTRESESGMRWTPTPDGKIGYEFDTPFDFERRDLSFWINFPVGPARPILIRLFAPDEQNQIVSYQYTTESLRKTWFGIDVGPTREIGSPNPRDVRGIQIEDSEGVRPIVFEGFATKPKAPSGRVMTIFDDNRASVASAYEEMHARGMPGAVAVIPDLVGEGGHLDAEQLRTYHQDGWDMVSHPQLEKPLPAYSKARQKEEIIRTKQWLVANGYTESADHFVTPYGRVGSETLEIIEDYHYTNYLSSNILSGTPPTDPLTIERVGIDDVAYAKRQIDRAARYNMLVVLSAHTVGNPDDRWISHERFVEILDYIQESSIEVTTPTDYWDTISQE